MKELNVAELDAVCGGNAPLVMNPIVVYGHSTQVGSQTWWNNIGGGGGSGDGGDYDTARNDEGGDGGEYTNVQFVWVPHAAEFVKDVAAGLVGNGIWNSFVQNAPATQPGSQFNPVGYELFTNVINGQPTLAWHKSDGAGNSSTWFDSNLDGVPDAHMIHIASTLNGVPFVMGYADTNLDNVADELITLNYAPGG